MFEDLGIFIFLIGLIFFLLILIICVYTGRCAYYLKKIYYKEARKIES